MLEIYKKDGTKDIIDTDSFSIQPLLDNKLKDYDIEGINKIKYILKYIKDGNRISDIKSNIKRISSTTSAKISIDDSMKYIFIVTIEGKFVDVIGLGKFLELSETFNLVNTFMQTDIELIEYIIRGTRFRGEYNKSLIIKFLSEETGNVNNTYVVEVLRHDMKKAEVKEFLPHVFYKLYQQKFEDSKINKKGGDKMSLKSIDGDELKKVTDNVRASLGGR